MLPQHAHAQDQKYTSDEEAACTDEPRAASSLPTLSMTVLCIAVLSEFLCANVSSPWILFMVQDFHQYTDDASNGYWAGVLASTFFLTQFLTSIFWAKFAIAYGQRAVIAASLLGCSITCLLFGMSTSIQWAMTTRFLQGVFGGAVGVARSCVPAVSNKSNDGRAYTVLSFAWGLGGVVGAIVGGALESPAGKWPSVSGQLSIFVKFPYLLPCAVAASVPLVGSIVCIFLGPDCGPRVRTNTPSSEKASAAETSWATALLDDTENYASYGSLGASFGRHRRGRSSARLDRFKYVSLSRSSSVVPSRGVLPSCAQNSTGHEVSLRPDADDEDSEAEEQDQNNRFYRTRSLPVPSPITRPSARWSTYCTPSIRRTQRTGSRSRPPAIRILGARPLQTLDASSSPPIASGPITASPLLRMIPIPDTLETQLLLHSGDVPTQAMPPITEAQVFALTTPGQDDAVCSKGSLFMQLPVLVIVQYGLLALYTAIHDQVFYLYFVSGYPAGGLGLDASSFSQLIALMCIAQIIYQFVIYPAIQSRCSSINVLRIGTMIFLPAYVAIISCRYMTDPALLSLALVWCTAVRFCAATFAFTAVSILLNNMSEPHVVGYANAVAQSLVSLARFLGPILGGLLWSTGVQDGPSGYYLGFVVCSALCALTLAHSFLVR